MTLIISLLFIPEVLRGLRVGGRGVSVNGPFVALQWGWDVGPELWKEGSF